MKLVNLGVIDKNCMDILKIQFQFISKSYLNTSTNSRSVVFNFFLKNPKCGYKVIGLGMCETKLVASKYAYGRCELVKAMEIFE